MQMGVAHLLRLYEHALSRAPATITGVVAGSLGFLGDALAQQVERRRATSLASGFDKKRSFAFTLYAIGWGAFGLRPWLILLNRRFPGSAPSDICKKVAVQQFVWNPIVYLPSFYVLNGTFRLDLDLHSALDPSSRNAVSQKGARTWTHSSRECATSTSTASCTSGRCGFRCPSASLPSSRCGTRWRPTSLQT
ncbi:MPV17 [Symbiodinium natans]|uniref:MPV17 protein n=1 Tax=Symbiodinium natans TaxID=878477 RepID=A0A812KKD2_9DINO|nr:MPV17 [Symbiodinium natans]